MGRIVRILVTLGLVAVVIIVIRRLMGGAGNPPPSTTPWEPVTPEPSLATTGSAPSGGSAGAVTTVDDRGPAGADGTDGEPVADAGATGWVEPGADGSCPSGFPVKAKLSSKIFHVPGGGSYERTSADRCYADAAAAEADGLRQAKR